MIPAVAALVTSLAPKILDLVSEVVTDKDKANEIAHKIATQAATNAHDLQKMQMEVNKVEAAHKSVFVAGWRPFIGWTCGVAMGLNYIVSPIVGIWTPMPVLDITTMFPILFGMLGMATLRTGEKVKGVSREK